MKSGLGPLIALTTLGVLLAVSCNPTGWFAANQDFLESGRTLSTFTAIQVDPRSEDSAGPQFVVAADLNDDGLLDLASAWNQSQPVQIHLQQRSATGGISFETLTLAGNIPVVFVSGLVAADFDQDGHTDVAVLVKESLAPGTSCLNECTPTEVRLSGVIIVYFGPDDPAQTNQALAWDEIAISSSWLAGTGTIMTDPENQGYSSLVAGDVTGDGLLDLVASRSAAAVCPCDGDDVLLFTNLGALSIRDGTWRVEAVPDDFYPDYDKQWTIKDVALADLDVDGDLDIVASRPDAGSLNVRWYRNPAIDVVDDYHVSDGEWHTGTVGQVDPYIGYESDLGGADMIRLGDINRDGLVDVVVRSTGGRVIQWFKNRPEGITTAPLRNIPWQVYTIAEFTARAPEAIALGDLNFDGQLELVVGAHGGLAWFDSQQAPSIYDQWIEELIIDDVPVDENSDVPATTDPNVEPSEIAGTTLMNSITIADLDGDGANDIIVTLDRSGLSGLSNDALVWFRNTQQP